MPLSNMEKEHLPSNQNRKLEQDKFTFFIAQKRRKKYLGKKGKPNKDQGKKQAEFLQSLNIIHQSKSVRDLFSKHLLCEEAKDDNKYR